MKKIQITFTEKDLFWIGLGLRSNLNNLTKMDVSIKNDVARALTKILKAQEKLKQQSSESTTGEKHE